MHTDARGEQDCNCSLGVWCIENKPENCPVIEALLVYIPWKREMFEEEEWDYYETNHDENGDDDLVESNILETAAQDEDDIPKQDWMGFQHFDGKQGVTINNTKMRPGNHYKIKDKNGGNDVIGEFCSLGRDGTIRMTQAEGVFHIVNIDNIENVILMTYSEMCDYWRRDVAGKCLETNHHYAIHQYSGVIYVGEFRYADALCIRMWDGSSITEININSIKRIDDIY